MYVVGLWLLYYSSLFGSWIKLGRKEDQYVALTSAWSCYSVLPIRNTHRQLQVIIMIHSEVLINMDFVQGEISLLVVLMTYS